MQFADGLAQPVTGMAEGLIETQDNPVPALAASGHFVSRDGIRLRYGLVGTPLRPRRGTVVILQGRNECIEKYFETATDLSARGFHVAMFDLRGQGGSQRLLKDPWRGHVTSFDDYVGDLDDFFVRIVLPDCPPPYYLLAHSTGALVALLSSPAMRNRIERQVLCAPLLQLASQYPPHRLVGLATGLLSSIGLGTLPMQGRIRGDGPFALSRQTSDERRHRRQVALSEAAPHLFLGAPTASWLDAFYRASGTVRSAGFIARIQLPTLILAGTGDRVVSYRAIESFAARLRSGSLLTIEGAQHEILQEADRYREQFLAAFDAFIPGAERPEPESVGPPA